jgi:Uma2 family endonuclease
MKSGNLRSPDVSFIAQSRLDAIGGNTPGFFHIAPDLAVEVLSPNERRKKIEEKLADYFESGTQLVWFVFSRTKTVRVYRDSKTSTLLDEHETLSGEEVVPGFSFSIQKLFEGM